MLLGLHATVILSSLEDLSVAWQGDDIEWQTLAASILFPFLGIFVSIASSYFEHTQVVLQAVSRDTGRFHTRVFGV